MTVDELIAEGRRLQRRTILLTPDGSGDPAALWYGHDYDKEPPDGHRCWICVNASVVPTFDGRGWLSIFTDDDSCQGGRVDASWALQARRRPSISEGDRGFADDRRRHRPRVAGGRTLVGENKLRRDWRYNPNFRDHGVVEKYEAVERQKNPLYWKDAYATLGGWHMGWPDDDWHNLLDAKLLVHTYMDSEPWVEAWQLPSGQRR